MPWKTPTPQFIPELAKRPELETLYQLLILNASNESRIAYTARGEPIELQKGQILFDRKEWNAKYGLPQSSRIILRRLHELKHALSLRMSLRKKRNCIVITLESYDELTSLVTQTVTHSYYKEKKKKYINTKQIKKQTEDIKQIFTNCSFPTQILESSFAEPQTLELLESLITNHTHKEIEKELTNQLTYIDSDCQLTPFLILESIKEILDSKNMNTEDTQKAGGNLEYITSDDFISQYFPELVDT